MFPADYMENCTLVYDRYFIVLPLEVFYSFAIRELWIFVKLILVYQICSLY